MIYSGPLTHSNRGRPPVSILIRSQNPLFHNDFDMHKYWYTSWIFGARSFGCISENVVYTQIHCVQLNTSGRIALVRFEATQGDRRENGLKELASSSLRAVWQIMEFELLVASAQPGQEQDIALTTFKA